MFSNFSPYDIVKSKGPLSDEKHFPCAVLKEQLSYEEMKEAFTKANKYANSPDAFNNNVRPLNLGDTLRKAYEVTLKREESYENFLGSSFRSTKLKVPRPNYPDIVKYLNRKFDPDEFQYTEVEEPKENKKLPWSLKDATKSSINILIAASAIIYSKVLQIKDCETPFTDMIQGIDATKLEESEVKDPKEHLKEQIRADILLAHYYIRQASRKLYGSYRRISEKDFKETYEGVAATLTNYQHIMKWWREENKSNEVPSEERLIQWYVKKRSYTKNPDTCEEDRNRLISDMCKFKYSKEKAIKKNIGNREHYLIDEIVYPSQLIVDKEGKIIAAIKVNAWTPEEFKAYVDQLILTIGIERQSKKDGGVLYPKEQEALKRSSFARDDLNVFMYPSPNKTDEEIKNYNTAGEAAGLRLGLDVDGLRKFVAVANCDQLEVDIKSKSDNSVKRVEVAVKPYPIFWRFSNDIDLNDIRRFNDVCNYLGIQNVIIQRMPVYLNVLTEQAHTYFNNYVSKQDEVKKQRYVTIDQLSTDPRYKVAYQIFGVLNNPNSWVEKTAE